MTLLSHAALAGVCGEVYADPYPTLGDPGGVRVYIRDYGDELVVCCAGTPTSGPDALAAWLRDFDAWPRWYYGMGVLHRGFGDGGTEVWAQLNRALPQAPFYTFCGHSLGGALASVVAACHSSHKGHGPFRLVTFGCPRVVAHLNSSFTRLVGRAAPGRWYQRRGDPVPHVPLARILGFNFYQDWDYSVVIGEPLPGSDPLWVDLARNDRNHAIELYQRDLEAERL